MIQFNEKNFDKVVAAIADSRHGFDIQETVVCDRTKKGSCGAMACIGGWAALLSKKGRLSTKTKYFSNMYFSTMEKIAERFMGIDHYEGEKLFYLTNWEEPFKNLYEKAYTMKERKQAALAYLAHFKAGKLLEAAQRQIEK